MFIVIVCVAVCEVIFWNLPWSSFQTVFLHDQKSQDKNVNILRTQRACKRLSLRQIRSTVLEGESPTLNLEFFSIPGKRVLKKEININRPVLLLSIWCSKVFKKLLFHTILEFTVENNVLNSIHSGFKLNASCFYRLILISNSVFSAFDANANLLSEVCGVFLDRSKVFHRT